jgi:hypothetical protein
MVKLFSIRPIPPIHQSYQLFLRFQCNTAINSCHLCEQPNSLSCTMCLCHSSGCVQRIGDRVPATQTRQKG